MDEMVKRILYGAERTEEIKRAPYADPRVPVISAATESQVLARLVREGHLAPNAWKAIMQAHHGHLHANGGIPTGVSAPVLIPHGITVKRGPPAYPPPGMVREHKRKRALRYESIIKRLEEAMGYNDNGDLMMLLGDARAMACTMLEEVRAEITAEDERFKP